MDPITAIGLAGSILQFITFASSLISEANEIHNSTSGSSVQTTNTQEAYARLEELSKKLASSSREDSLLQPFGESRNYDGNIVAINDLADLCHKDSKRLLDVVSRLTLQDASRNRWHSLHMAIKTAWTRKEIAELEQRLHNTQATLTFHLCASTRYEHRSRYTHIPLRAQHSTMCVNLKAE